MRNRLFVMLAVSALIATACNQKQPAEQPADTTPEEQPVQILFEGFKDTVELELVPVEKAQAKPAAKKSSQAAAVIKGKAEKIYVETDGAQGRVWGYVTMRGDKGTGTIHDWDENTLAVTVTRHGNELFAVDQNSRQYVFKVR